MSDAFAVAATALAADPNLGVDAVWTSRLGGSSIDVRVVPSSPESTYGGGDGPTVAGVVASATMTAAAIPGRPERGDLLAYGGADYVVAEIAQDARGVSYRLHLRRA
jgi:hypothetical protein